MLLRGKFSLLDWTKVSKLHAGRPAAGISYASVSNRMRFVYLAIVIIFFASSCIGPSFSPEHNSQELAQQIGDVMASIDEFGAASEPPTAFVNPLEPRCLDLNYSDCSVRGQKVRTFNDCTIQSAVFAGSTTFNWSNATLCQLTRLLENISRSPNIRTTGRRNATLIIQKSGSYGQRLTWVSGNGTDKVFTFESDGINRVFKTQTGLVDFDHTTFTEAPLVVTGTTRSNRIVTGGTLRVRDNLSQSFCDYTPENVAWASSCNCPTKGVWSGTCSNENLTSLTITGCGTGHFEDGTFSEEVVFDRCGL